jgi:hypothetical protein
MTGKTCGHGTFMRPETPANQHECTAYHGAGTRVEIHRSRYELERVGGSHSLASAGQGQAKGKGGQ